MYTSALLDVALHISGLKLKNAKKINFQIKKKCANCINCILISLVEIEDFFRQYFDVKFLIFTNENFNSINKTHCVFYIFWARFRIIDLSALTKYLRVLLVYVGKTLT